MSLDNLQKNVLIFTDLDGTLLDHDSYRFDEASVMLDYLKMHHIPLIIVTSKTKKEVIRLQKLLEIEAPCIIENGAGILIPRNGGYETIAMGQDYKAIRRAFERAAFPICAPKRSPPAQTCRSRRQPMPGSVSLPSPLSLRMKAHWMRSGNWPTGTGFRSFKGDVSII